MRWHSKAPHCYLSGEARERPCQTSTGLVLGSAARPAVLLSCCLRPRFASPPRRAIEDVTVLLTAAVSSRQFACAFVRAAVSLWAAQVGVL